MVESVFRDKSEEINTEIVDVELYQKMIGCLLYIARRTKPDIMVAINILSLF